MNYLDQWAAGRQNRADRYRRLFAQRGTGALVNCPLAPSDCHHHVYNQFTIRTQKRDDLKEALGMQGIPTEIYYPLCLHLQKSFAHLGYRPGELPEAEKSSQEVLSLPIYPELSDSQQDKVVEAIAKFHQTRN